MTAPGARAGVRLYPEDRMTALHEPAIEVPPLAVMCAEPHPFDDSVLCRVIGPHDLHDPDGGDPWSESPDEPRRTA